MKIDLPGTRANIRWENQRILHQLGPRGAVSLCDSLGQDIPANLKFRLASGLMWDQGLYLQIQALVSSKQHVCPLSAQAIGVGWRTQSQAAFGERAA